MAALGRIVVTFGIAVWGSLHRPPLVSSPPFDLFFFGRGSYTARCSMQCAATERRGNEHNLGAVNSPLCGPDGIMASEPASARKRRAALVAQRIFSERLRYGKAGLASLRTGCWMSGLLLFVRERACEFAV